ncbi:MAG: pyridoxamine 5'-phosphate oxidase family protein [Spirochaetes bacterium]|nr:pyridoxamine 5'-phosphate oxidase family protein [Spirochaetota bacterium]
MNIHDYFESKRGLGVLATADSDGKVNTAIYSRPHVINDETVAFIMADRRSHRNLQSNSRASYLFREDTAGFDGMRLYLEKIREEKNSPLIEELRRKKRAESARDADADRFLVFFRITERRPLVGNGE